MRNLRSSCAALFSTLLFTGCYTLKQGYYQAKLFTQSTPIEEVLLANTESPERLNKLRIVPQVLRFAQEKLSLKVGKSYQKYISLPGNALTFTVQAAYPRELKFFTWWFPVVGAQPYLGFFDKSEAIEFEKKMRAQGYDTALGGVQAFSLLGYLPDPVYSSMLDGNSLLDLIETLIHESLHATLYIPGYSNFNENLANFYGQQGALAFLREHPDMSFDIEQIAANYKRDMQVQQLFRVFLLEARKNLETFYNESRVSVALQNNEAFLQAREQKFNELADKYKDFMKGREKGSNWEFAFSKGRINNATILRYSLYEAFDEPFKILLERVGTLPRFLHALQKCLKEVPSTEEELWKKVELCKED